MIKKEEKTIIGTIILLVLATSIVLGQAGMQPPQGVLDDEIKTPTAEELEMLSDATARYLSGNPSQADMKLLEENNVDLELLKYTQQKLSSTGNVVQNTNNEELQNLENGMNMLMIVLGIFILFSLIMFFILFKKAK